jgi:hypothetical protein
MISVTPLVLDLTSDDLQVLPASPSDDVISFDKDNAIRRAHIHFQHQYPATIKGQHIISFKFGLVPIIHAALGNKTFDFQYLRLVCDVALLDSCVLLCRGILLNSDKVHTPDDYFNSMDLAFSALRDKHVLSIITKILLLPLIVAWFRPVLTSTCIMYSMPKFSRASRQDILVVVKEYYPGNGSNFFDIEKTDQIDTNKIDYFFAN